MNLLILGANSDVAYAIAKAFAKHSKADIYLASRDMKLLEKKAQDLKIRYEIKAACLYFDAMDFESHLKFYQSIGCML